MSAPEVLIGEDDAFLREGLRHLLTIEGFRARVAADGAAVLAEIAAARPDALVLDLMMPKVDGLEVCRAARARDAALPILILSARDTELDRVIGLEQGADDYLTKPFGPRELVARIRALLRRSAAGRPEVLADAGRLRMGDLDIDADGLRAFRDGRAIDLTARELKVLRILAARPGKAVTRDELLDLAWGQDFMPNSRSLDQYISALRRKIERDPAAPRIIRTVHGLGYRFDG